MIYQTIRKEGDHYVVTIPRDEVERQNLHDGQLVAIEVQPADPRTYLEQSPDLKQAFEESWQRNEAGYRYLKGC